MAGATAIGSLSPQRANSQLETVVCKFDVGASGAHTLSIGHGMSVAETAPGKYTVTFTGGSRKNLIDFRGQHWAQANAGPLLIRPTDGGFTAATASADATLTIEAWDLDTSAQTEIPSGDAVTYTAVFLKTNS